MTLASPRGSPAMAAFPRTLSSIAVSVGGLALFLVFASWLLVSYPIAPTVRGYFYSIDDSKKLDFPISPDNQTTIDRLHDANIDAVDKNSPSWSNVEVPMSSKDPSIDDSINVINKKFSHSESDSQVPMSSNDPPVVLETKEMVDQKAPVSELSPSLKPEVAETVSVSSNVTENIEMVKPLSSGSPNQTIDTGTDDPTPASSSDDSKTVGIRASSMASNTAEVGSVESGCDLYHGKWYYDSSGPLYTNNTCPVLSQMQNCQGNGRPDKDYENWRWKPFQCDLPRFDGKKFLELMRGKTLAFIGDSVARNQMESMMCILWQVETPKSRGNKKMQRWYFRSSSVMIVRIWSSWLVHGTSESFDYAPGGVTKLHLDAPDQDLIELIPKFDVVVLSSGHWFAKQSVYILNNEIVGGQLWWPNKARPMKINNIEAFGISVETILTALVTHQNYTGLTIVRSYSPDHYEGGAWNTGGSCTGKERPLAAGKLVENRFTKIMHEKQVAGFNRAIKKATNKSKLRLMDITDAFGYRHDGHPGPYRNTDPNKLTKRGPDGKPPPQDCLHWCMPGPVDTWNELVFEIIRREFEGNQSFTS